MKQVKSKWRTGIIYAVVILVLCALTVYGGLYIAMPEELVVYDANDQAVSVLFTDDLYFTSMELMMVSALFPAGAYLWMYGWYADLGGKNSQYITNIKRGERGGTRAWVIPGIVLLVLVAVWALVSWGMLSLSLNLDTALFKDAIMCRQYFLVYGVSAVVELLLYAVGKLLFKPEIIQTA